MNEILPAEQVAALLGAVIQPNNRHARARARRARGEYTERDGRLLREWMKKGFSQVGAADRLGIPRGLVSHVLALTRGR